MISGELLRLAAYYVFLAFILRFLVLYGYRVLLHPLRKYPGPFIASITDWYGAYYALRKSLHIVTYEDHQKYGNVIRQGPNKLVFNTVSAMRDIYRDDKLFKARSYVATQDDPKIPSILSAIDKQLHRRKKKIVGNGLSEKHLRQFEPTMMSHIDIFINQLLEASKSGEVVDMTIKSKYLGLDISSQFGFGISLDMQTNSKNRFLDAGMRAAVYRTYVYMQYLSAKYLGVDLLLIRPLYAIRKQYREALHSLVSRRLEMGKHAKDDLFSFVIDEKDPETGAGMTEMELFVESEIYLIAGGQTTSSAIAALLFYLSRYPECYKRLVNEIRSTFSNGSEIVSGTTLSGCKYLRACIDETLRMSPPVPGTMWREYPEVLTEGEVVIDGHVIPRGTLVGVNTYALHHNESYFSKPFEFIPERWLANDEKETNQAEAERKHSHDAFVPFSIGTRSCAGKGLANMQIPLVIAKTLWYLDFERPAQDAVQSEETIVGRSRGCVGKNEYEIYDQLIATHHGPNLRFKATGNP
ncbi:cytochrome P450 [Periconia macrospinosa]|uniref:Cytochrome P450 n=1 Tax=Periconia macrospinosa TaxID=97972 RepID=A0A2V1DDM3_9PLEO|nr:cytochrome P450 [Periconia macrospinosa]